MRLITSCALRKLFFVILAGASVGQLGTSLIAQTVSFTEYSVPTPTSRLFSITAGPDGALWFTEAAGNKIGRITTAGVITEFPIPTTTSTPAGITAGPDGALWFTEAVGNKIGRITTAGIITEFLVPTAGSGLNGITAGPDGALWFTEDSGNKIGRITTAGVINEFPVPTAASQLVEIVTGSDGALWFTEGIGRKIGRITTAGVITEFPVPTASQLSSIATGPDGAVWFTEYNVEAKIGRITTAGTITEFPLSTTGLSEIPVGITASPDGALWFTDLSQPGDFLGVPDKIGRITTTGVITEFRLPAGGFLPWGITTGPDGALWFTEGISNRIGRAFPVQISVATHFVPVTPCRVADTRTPNGPLGGPAIAGGAFRDFVIPNSVCGIPSNAAGYSLNVTVVPAGTLGFLTLWPSGQSRPLVATLNSIDGRIKSNAAIVPAGVNGAVSVFAKDTTDVILDINGYFVPVSSPSVPGFSPTALAFYPLTPCRIADTRNPNGPLGGPGLVAQGTRSFPILASSCGLPSNAQAYSLNFAAVPKGPSLGFLTAWPAGQQQPLVASLNDPTGTVAANAVVVPAGANGDVNVFTTDATDLVIDINGYFAPQGPGGLSLYMPTPCRVLDTRLPLGSPPFSATQDVNVTAAPCGAPVTAQAFVFNATVVPPGFLGYITMYPQGQTLPLAATLNAYDGAVTNNMAIVPTTTGSVSVFPSAPTHLVLDIFGYFAP